MTTEILLCQQDAGYVRVHVVLLGALGDQRIKLHPRILAGGAQPGLLDPLRGATMSQEPGPNSVSSSVAPMVRRRSLRPLLRSRSVNVFVIGWPE